jgi:hypothetical protein
MRMIAHRQSVFTNGDHHKRGLYWGIICFVVCIVGSGCKTIPSVEWNKTPTHTSVTINRASETNLLFRWIDISITQPPEHGTNCLIDVFLNGKYRVDYYSRLGNEAILKTAVGHFSKEFTDDLIQAIQVDWKWRSTNPPPALYVTRLGSNFNSPPFEVNAALVYIHHVRIVGRSRDTLEFQELESTIVLKPRPGEVRFESPSERRMSNEIDRRQVFKHLLASDSCAR